MDLSPFDSKPAIFICLLHSVLPAKSETYILTQINIVNSFTVFQMFFLCLVDNKLYNFNIRKRPKKKKFRGLPV